MGLLKLAIILDHPVYYAGQIISGKLVVGVDKPMSMREMVQKISLNLDVLLSAIHLKYSGEGRVHWTETYRSNNQSHTRSYDNSEHYLALQQLIYGNDTGDCQLAEGEHVFVFHCQLPINLPSSFEGPYGRIRYSIKATINRPWRLDHVVTQPITVMPVFDLNRNALAAAPVNQHAGKTFWGHSKQLSMSVNLPVRGFVPGQILPIRVFLNNETKVQVSSICVTLKQNVIFHAINKSRAVKMHVFKNEFPVQEGFGSEEVPINLQVPAVPPSYLQFSRIIDLNYQLNVKARVNAWYHRNLKIPVEVIIGNIPLMSYQIPISAYQPHHEDIGQEYPSQSQPPHYQPPPYGFDLPDGPPCGQLPPPTYEQSFGLGRSKRDNPVDDPDSDGEVTAFAPLYPVYKFETVNE